MIIADPHGTPHTPDTASAPGEWDQFALLKFYQSIIAVTTGLTAVTCTIYTPPVPRGLGVFHRRKPRALGRK
jgi:hypothetical protein